MFHKYVSLRVVCPWPWCEEFFKIFNLLFFFQISPADLDGMDNLTILYLHNNAVKDLGSSLKSLRSLALLDISGNQLKNVTVSIFKSTHPLKGDQRKKNQSGRKKKIW